MNQRGHGFFRIILVLSLGTQITKEQPFPDTEGFTQNGIHDVIPQNTSSSKTIQKDDGYYLDLLNGICREGWVKGRVNDVTVCLRTNSDPMSWEDARDTCRSEFSFLMKMEAPVTVESKDLGDYLKEKNIDQIWTGLHEEGGFLVWDEIAPHKVRAYNDPLEEELLQRRIWNWNIEPDVNDDIDDSDDFEFQEEESHSTCGSLNFNRHYGEHVISKRAVNRSVKNAKSLHIDDVFESDHTPSPTSREIDNSPDSTKSRPQKGKMNLLQFMQHLKQLTKLNARRRLGTVHSANDNKKYVNSQRVRMTEKNENDQEFTTNLNEDIEPVNPTEETDFFERRKKESFPKLPPKTPPKLFPSFFDSFKDDNSTIKGNVAENFTKFDQNIDNSTSESRVILPIPTFSTKEKAREEANVYPDDYVNYDDLILNESKKKSTQVTVLKPTPATPYKKVKPVPTPPTTNHGKRLKMIKPPPVKVKTQPKSKNVTMESESSEERIKIKNPIGIAKTLVRKNAGQNRGLSKAEKAKRITDSLATSSEDISKEDSDELDDSSSNQNTTNNVRKITIQKKDDANGKNFDKLPTTLDIPPLIDIKKHQSKEASKDSSRLSDERKQRHSETDEVVSRDGIESESEERLQVDTKNNNNEQLMDDETVKKNDKDKKETAKPVPISLGSEESEDVKAYLEALKASIRKVKAEAQKEPTAVSSEEKDDQKKKNVKSSTLFNTRTDYDLTESDSLVTNTEQSNESKNTRRKTEKAKESLKGKINKKRMDKKKQKSIIDKKLILDLPPPPPPIKSTQGKKENKKNVQKLRANKGNQDLKENNKRMLPKVSNKNKGLAIPLKTTGDIGDTYVKDYINALKAARKQNPLSIATNSKKISKPIAKHAKIISENSNKKVHKNDTTKKLKVSSESTDRSKSSSSYSEKESSLSDSISSENLSSEDEETHRIRDTESKRKSVKDNRSPPSINVEEKQNIKENNPSNTGSSEKISGNPISNKSDQNIVEKSSNAAKVKEIKSDKIQRKSPDKQKDKDFKNQNKEVVTSSANIEKELAKIPNVTSESKETEEKDSEENKNLKGEEKKSDISESKPILTKIQNEEKLKRENPPRITPRKVNLESRKAIKKNKEQSTADLPAVINIDVPLVKTERKKTIENDDKSEEEGEEKESKELSIEQPVLTTTTQSMLNRHDDTELPNKTNKKAGGIVIPTQSNIIFGSMTENPKDKESEEAISKESDIVMAASTKNKGSVEIDDKSIPISKSRNVDLKSVKIVSKKSLEEKDKAKSNNQIQTTISFLESSSNSASSEILHSSMQSDDVDDSAPLTENRESEPDDETGKLVIDMTDKNKTDSYSSDEESNENTSSQSVTLTPDVDDYETTTSSEDDSIKGSGATLSLPSTLYDITKVNKARSDSKDRVKQGSEDVSSKSSEKMSVDHLSVESTESNEIVESVEKQSSYSSKENDLPVKSDYHIDNKLTEASVNTTDLLGEDNIDSKKERVENVENISKSSEEISKDDESKEIVRTTMPSRPSSKLIKNDVKDTDEDESDEDKETHQSTTSLPVIEVINNQSGGNDEFGVVEDSREDTFDVLRAGTMPKNDSGDKGTERNNEISKSALNKDENDSPENKDSDVENVEDLKDVKSTSKESVESNENSSNFPGKSNSDERNVTEEDDSSSKESFKPNEEENSDGNIKLSSIVDNAILKLDDDTSTSSESNDASEVETDESFSKYLSSVKDDKKNSITVNSISKESLDTSEEKNVDNLKKHPKDVENYNTNLGIDISSSEESEETFKVQSNNNSSVLTFDLKDSNRTLSDDPSFSLESVETLQENNDSLEKFSKDVENDNTNFRIEMSTSGQSEETFKVKSDNDSSTYTSDKKDSNEILNDDTSFSGESIETSEDSDNNSDIPAKQSFNVENNNEDLNFDSNISKESVENPIESKDGSMTSPDDLENVYKTFDEISTNSNESEEYSKESEENIPINDAENITHNLSVKNTKSKESTEESEERNNVNTIEETNKHKILNNETTGSIESEETSEEEYKESFTDAKLVNKSAIDESSISEESAENLDKKQEDSLENFPSDVEEIIENLSKDSSNSNESGEKSEEDTDEIPAKLSTDVKKVANVGVKSKSSTDSLENTRDASPTEEDDIDSTHFRSSDENKLIRSGSYEIKDYLAEQFKNFEEPQDDEAMYMKEVNRDKMERDKNYERDISQEIPIVLEAIKNIDDSQERTTVIQSDEAFRSLFERLSNKTRDLMAEAASKDEVRHREDQDLDLAGIRGEISDDMDMDPEDILAQEADLRAEANVKGALLPSYSKPQTITKKIDISKANMKLSNCNARRTSLCFTYPVTVESTASSCDSGWVGHVFHRKCYRIMRNANTIPKMQYKNAKNICEMEGGDVAHMTDGYGGRFLIMTLLKSIKENTKELPPKENIPPVWVYSPTSDPSCHVMTPSGPIAMGCNQSIAVAICEKNANDIGVQTTGNSHPSLGIMEFTLNDKKILKCDLKNSAAELPILWFKDGRLVDIKVKKRKESILPHLGGRPISPLPEPAETPITSLELNTWLRKTLQTSTEHPVSEEVFQGNYWCEGWTSRPFARMKSDEIFVRFKDVITFVGRVRLPAIPYDERLLHNKIEKNLPPIMNIMTDLRFINEIVFRKLQQEFPNLESISAFPGEISSKPPLQLSYNIYIRASKNYTIADEIPLFKSLRSRYQEILMDGNILTRLPRGTPIRFIRSIRIRSTVSCQQTELRDPRTRLVANFFPAGIKLNVSSIEVCENGEKAGKATCKGDFRSGAYWGNIRIKQGCGISETHTEEDTNDESNDVTDSEEAVEEYENLVQKMTPEERLKELAEMDIEENNLESIIEETAEITDTVEEIKENDLEYINEIMEKSAISEGKTKFVALKAIQTVNRLLMMDDDVFEKAKRVSSIIKNFERIVEDTELSDDGYFRLVLPNVAMEIYELEKQSKPVIGMAAKTDEHGNVMYTPFDQKRIVTIYNDSAFYEDVDVAIHLPPELVHDTKAENKSRLYMMVYRDGNMFQDSSVPISVAEAPRVIKSHDLKRLNSFVISASIGGKKIEGLQQKVKTIFRPLKDPAGRARTCAFYNFTMNNNAGGWSSAGCVYDGQVNGRDVCLCDHLTNFAVLVDFYGQDDRVDRVHEVSLSIISLIGLSLSIIGLSLTIISFVFFRKLRKGRAQQTLFNLALSMLCSWVIFLVGIKQTYHFIGCLIVAVLLHYFILASFMWMLMEAFLQYLTFVKVLGTYVTRYTLKSVIAAWGLPLIPVICILSIDHNLYKGGDHYCWMSLDAFYYGFALPIGLIILANLIVFIITVVSIFRRPQGLRSNQSKHKMAITNLQAAITSFVLLGLSWILGYFAISDARLPFQYAFTILNSLQGFFIFVLFVARKKQVREQWKMICCCIFPDQQKAQRTLSASASYPSTCSSRSTSSTSTLHHGRTERSDSCKTTTSFIGSEYDSIYTVPYARSSRDSLYYRKL